MAEIDNMQTLIDAALTGANTEVLYETPGLLKIYIPSHDGPGRGRVVDVDLSPTLPTPLRKRGIVRVFNAASFNQVIADNSDAGNIAIYFERNPASPAIVAVLNGHGKDGPGWGDFRAHIEFRKTPQWTKWLDIDGKMLSQADFAEFIEDNLADIHKPAGGEILDIVTYFQATRTVNFKSAKQLGSGAVQFLNNESIDATVSAGDIRVPSEFILGIQPYAGGPACKVPARFRYRMQDGKLALGVRLQRIEDMIAAIFEEVAAKIERGANISVLDGLPPA